MDQPEKNRADAHEEVPPLIVQIISFPIILSCVLFEQGAHPPSYRDTLLNLLAAMRKTPEAQRPELGALLDSLWQQVERLNTAIVQKRFENDRTAAKAEFGIPFCQTMQQLFDRYETLFPEQAKARVRVFRNCRGLLSRFIADLDPNRQISFPHIKRRQS